MKRKLAFVFGEIAPLTKKQISSLNLGLLLCLRQILKLSEDKAQSTLIF
jgi:hypothetical protein